MTMFAVDPSKSTASEQTTHPIGRGEFEVCPPTAARVLLFVSRRVLPPTDELLERFAFAKLSEESFAEDWDSPEDAIYNDLP